MQGPSRRPAIFSHDKLIWRCCQEVVGALAASTAKPGVIPAASASHTVSKSHGLSPEERAVQNEINRLTGKSSSSLAWPPATAMPSLQQPSQRDLALLALGLKPASSMPSAPMAVSVTVHAHTQTSKLTKSIAKQIGLTQPELTVLCQELDRLITPELKMRTALRAASIREAAISEAAMVTPDGDLPSCHWCGHGSYLSYVKCSCRCGFLLVLHG